MDENRRSFRALLDSKGIGTAVPPDKEEIFCKQELDDPKNLEAVCGLEEAMAVLQSKPYSLTGGAAARLIKAFRPGGTRVIPWRAHASKAITRVMHGVECIGTICRIRRDGICATAEHCISEGSTCLDVLDGLTAFGKPLHFIAAFHDLDLALFQGTEGTALELAVGMWASDTMTPGVPVQLASFPQPIDSEFNDNTADLSFTAGQVTSCAESGRVASADYTLCMPNSSGGGVLLQESGRLAGLHIGISYHEESSRSTPCNSSSGQRKQPKQQDMEKDAKKLKKSPNIEAVDDTEAAQRSFSNIGHKAYGGLYIPAPAMATCMILAGVAHDEPMVQMVKMVAGRAARSRKQQGSPSQLQCKGRGQHKVQGQSQSQHHGIMLKGVPESTGMHTHFGEE